jgi:hypothetical protein
MRWRFGFERKFFYFTPFQPAKPAEEKAEAKHKKITNKPQFYTEDQRDADDDTR